MENAPSPENQENISPSPEPEVLQPRVNDDGTVPPQTTPTPDNDTKTKPSRLRRRTFRPSHKATFIGIAAVLLILAINAVVIEVVLKKQSNNDDLSNKGQVTISSADLSRLGIDRNTIGGAGVELIVAPDAQFKGKLSVAGGVNVNGQLTLNGKLTGTSASFTQLQAGDTSLSKLSVNGDSTLSSLNLRKDLVVAGITKMQGSVTVSQLLSVGGSINVNGNLSIGGTLTVSKFSVQTLTVNGHLLTSGSTPGVGPGSAVGSYGTVSISGNDTAGTIYVAFGVGSHDGTFANVTFRTQYGNTPKVVVTPIGIGGTLYLTSVTTSGFTVAGSFPSGGYGFGINYIVVQ
jgi:cytoskeletal protein CcmA (bactofilin family)